MAKATSSSGWSPPKLAVAVIATAYFLWCAIDPFQWHFIDGVNLVIHEAGHTVFSPLGEFMMIAGGSLFQVIIPAGFWAYFLYRGQQYSAALVLFWVGESLLNVSVYASDAQAMQLPLLGGGDSQHDWNYLLTSLNVLQSTDMIAFVIRGLGTIVILVAALRSVRFSRKTTFNL